MRPDGLGNDLAAEVLVPARLQDLFQDIPVENVDAG